MNEFHAFGLDYSIVERNISFDDNVEEHYVKLQGWSNQRLFLIDKSNDVGYFQVTSSHETGRGPACSICAGRLRHFSHLHRTSEFVTLMSYRSIYLKLSLGGKTTFSKDVIASILRVHLE